MYSYGVKHSYLVNKHKFNLHNVNHSGCNVIADAKTCTNPNILYFHV